MVIERYKQNNN